MYTRTLIRHRRSREVDAAVPKNIAPVRFLALRGFSAHQLAYTLDSLVRVSRRADEAPSASIRQTQIPKISKSAWSSLCRSRRIGRVTTPTFVRRDQHMLTSVQCMQATTSATVYLDAPAETPSLPSQQFQVLLTLFSKFFSSFPHGTCSLSVSRQYLALDGIYHLLWAEFPINPTRRQRLVGYQTQSPTGFSPSRTHHSR